MNKLEIYEFLNKKGIQYEVDEHEAVYNMEQLSQVDLKYPEADAKNLFVRDDKRKHYYLISVKGDKRVNLKVLRKEYNTRPLSFASDDELNEIMGLIPGAVTPLGLLNDMECKVSLFLDKELYDLGMIGVHPNDNRATLWIKVNDLIDIIKEHGNLVEIIVVKEL